MRRTLLAATCLTMLPAQGVAQSLATPLAHWHHTAWTGEAGPPRAGEHLITRSPDGYLWLSATGALLRFDGIRFTVIDSSTVPALRPAVPGQFVGMSVDRDGVMWVRGPGGAVLTYRDGRFRERLAAGSGIDGIVTSDGLGRIWARGDRIVLLGDSGLAAAPLPGDFPRSEIQGIERDTGNGVWIGTRDAGLWHVTGTSSRQYGTGRIRALRQSSDGSVWAIGPGLGEGLWRLVGDEFEPVRFPDEPSSPILTRFAVEGPDGSMWFPTSTMGIVRWRRGVLERFGTPEGLSHPRVHDLTIDDHGTVWATTDAGLDRLRPATFVAIDGARGLPYESGYLFAEDVSGAIWGQGFAGGLFLLDGGVIRGRAGPIRATRVDPPSGARFQLLTASGRGGVWLAPFAGGLLLRDRSGQRIFASDAGLPKERLVRGWETRDGTLWLLTFGGGFGRFRDGRYQPIAIDGQALPNVDAVDEDGAGRTWVAVRGRATLALFDGDRIVSNAVLPEDGRARITGLAPEGRDTMWVATMRSLVRFVAGRGVAVRVPALATILAQQAAIAVSRGQLWIAGDAGVARVPLAALHRAADGDSLPVTPVVMGTLDGLRIPRTSSLTPIAIRVGKDGRVWLATPTGLAVADVGDGPIASVPPLVHVEELSVSGRTLSIEDGGKIAPNPDRVAIRYTATTSLLPERLRLEYRLDGADREWVAGALPRVATYTRLRPGAYRFRVRAWNEDGVPGAREASLRFTVMPAWYQSWWFYGLCVLAVAGSGSLVVGMAHRERMRRGSERMEARFEAVLEERTRISRELHDTLLQGFTGITLQLEGVRGKLAQREDASATELSNILRVADATLREAREMVWDMRSPELATSDLAGALEEAGRRARNGDAVALRYVVNGTRRRLPPAVETTVLRIGREAVVNALRHADASVVVTELTYEPHGIVLDVQDDGRGSDPDALDGATAAGHWGVAGMRERAIRAGGTLAIHTVRGEGTRIRLALPAEPIA